MSEKETVEIPREEYERISKGNMVATTVWHWLQEEKAIDYVPWTHSKPDVQIRREVKLELLDQLEKVILNAS